MQVVPLTDPLYSRRHEDHHEQYFGALQIGGLTTDDSHREPPQIVAVGHLWMLQDDNQIGQVLALKSHATISDIQYWAILRILQSFHKIKSQLTKAQIHAVKQYGRVTHALMETKITLTIPVSHCQHQIHLMTPGSIPPSIYHRFGYGTFHDDEDGGTLVRHDDWNRYHLDEEDGATTAPNPPTALLRAWHDCLRDDIPVQHALQQQWHLVAMVHANWRKNQQHLTPTTTTNSPPTPPTPPPPRVSIPVRSKKGPIPVRQRRIKDKGRNQPPRPKQQRCVPDDDDDDDVSLQPLSSSFNNNRKRLRMEQSCHGGGGGGGVVVASMEPSVVTLHHQGRRLHFTTQVTVVSRTRVQPQPKRQSTQKSSSSSWTIGIGDTIAVACPHARHGPNPFAVRWSVGQVLSLYYGDDGTDMESNNKKNNMQMEVRWLYHPSELLLVNPHVKDDYHDWQPNEVVEVDEHVSVEPVTSALGQVQVSSTIVSHDSRAIHKQGGIPSVLCRRIFYSQYDESRVRSLPDWTQYGSTLTGPLSRGLLCEKAWVGKKVGHTLQKKYKAYLVERYKIPNIKLNPNAMRKDDDGDAEILQDTEESVPRPGRGVAAAGKVEYSKWPAELLNAGVLKLQFGYRVIYRQPLGGESRRIREFVEYASVSVIHQRCDPRTTSSKATDHKWKLSVGDFVCLADNESAVPTSPSTTPRKHKNPWYPFLGPWRYCQVLSIYRYYESESDKKDGSLWLEVRRFHRKSDLPLHVAPWMPTLSSVEEEIFETFTIECEVDASRVLGKALVYLGHHGEVPGKDQIPKSVPTAPCRCRYSYRDSRESFQPLFCAGRTATSWHNRMLERGLMASEFGRQDPVLAGGIEMVCELMVQKTMDQLELVFDGMLDESEGQTTSEEARLLRITKAPSHSDLLYFTSAPLEPLWALYDSVDTWCSKSDRKGLHWTVRVGDVVAARSAEHAASATESDHLPYKQAWFPCQVLCIHRRTDSTPSEFFVEVRWLEREREKNGGLKLGSVYEPVSARVEVIDAASLLSPIGLLCKEHLSSFWSSIPAFLPSLPLVFGGTRTLEISATSQVASADALRLFVRTGIEKSSHYRGREEEVWNLLKEEVRRAVSADASCSLQLKLILADSTEDPSLVSSPKGSPLSRTGIASLGSGSKATQVRTSDAPFHVDKSTGLEFYDKLWIETPFDSYADELKELSKPNHSGWNLELGDPVVVFYKVPGAGRRKKSEMYPMAVPWAVAEVVTILKKQSTQGNDRDDDECTLEVRWLYREKEIPGQSATIKTKEIAEFEEVFESDHYNEIPSSSILAPAILEDGSGTSQGTKPDGGFPVVKFLCRNFWSFHRKCLIPSNGLPGRIDRGRAQSAFVSKHSALRDHVTKAAVEAASSRSLPTTPREAFQNVVEKMSLVDASKEAFHGGSSTLIGRDKERLQIKKFLHDAISGSTEDNKPSMFIGGAPGMGKTACIRACIHDLRRDQAAGRVADFDFVLLNGMEMRTADEAYIKLWEDISKDKSRCNASVAASKLSDYFNGKEDEAARRRVIVLLVDEIDYLVTKKQTVLYDLFTWPIQSRQLNKRLITVGISNTLNLPDRMHPRVQSRIGTRRCYFQSYNMEQTADILNAKMRQASPNYTVFHTDAITFVARKTAAMSGDLRKALRICGFAAERMLEAIENGTTANDQPIVGISDVLAASRECSNTAQSRTASSLAPLEALLLVTVANLTRSTGRETGGFDLEEIMSKMSSIANSLGDPTYLPAPSFDETRLLISRLSRLRLLDCRTSRVSSLCFGESGCCGGPWPWISPTMDEIAVFTALKTTSHRDLAQKYILDLSAVATVVTLNKK